MNANQKDTTLIVSTSTTRPVALLGEVGTGSELSLPGDKSLSHRAALFAALAEGESCIDNFQVSGVTRAMLDALTTLGVRWVLDQTKLRVQGWGLRGRYAPEGVVIDCGNSGTTMRLLAGALAAWGITATLDGSQGLRRRPMGRIVAPLQEMGVVIDADDGHAPLVIEPASVPLQALNYTLPVASAQVKSCLLLAALAAKGTTTLIEPGPSRDHTERMLRGMGVSAISEKQSSGVGLAYITQLNPPEPLVLEPLNLDLPGDISGAAFLIVAGLIVPGSEVLLRGVGLNPTRTGLLDALFSMGAQIEIKNQSERAGEPVGDILIRHSELQGTLVSGELVVRMIDEFPVFAVAAACAEGETVVSEAGELRHKESDRITALCQELSLLGVKVSETPDGFIIQGGHQLKGGVVDSHGDHRLAMALSIAGLVAQETVTIQGAHTIGESFPGFVPILQALGADMRFDG